MIEAVLKRTRLIATLVFLISVLGVLSWTTMPRQEDPSFVDRFASLVVALPGASSVDVERLVLQPIEDRLEEVNELDRVVGTARTDVGVFELRLKESISEAGTAEAWQEVRRAIEAARSDLPAEALEPILDTHVGDPATAVFLLTGTEDLLELRAAAKRLQDRLQRVAGVERVELVGDPGREVQISIAPETSSRLGLTPEGLADRVRNHNITVPGGSVDLQGRGVVLRHLGELTSVDAIAQVPIPLASGATVPLGSIATVQEASALPRTSRVLHDGSPAVGVSVVPSPQQDLVALGARIDLALQDVEPELSALELHRFAFQPALVEARLNELSGSLVFGMLIVAGVLMLTMGPRMGTVVSVIVPLVAIGTIGIYAFGGGVLHQISIAALVLALGLLVDNAIVVAEAVQQNLDAGVPDPATAAVRELAIPLGTATGTTVAAFVPMLLSSGGTAEFTRTIPLMVILALVLSYFYALAVTPLLAARLLKAAPAEPGRLERLGRWMSQVTTRRPVHVLAVVGAGLFATLLSLRFVSAEFFPMSDRDKVMVSVQLAEGTPARTTEKVVGEMVQAWSQDPDVASTTAFVGGGLPRFYYNLNDSPNSPHRAEIVLSAPAADLEALLPRIQLAARAWPEATVVAKRLQQGPPVGSPVQIRLHGTALADLEVASQRVVQALREVPGARNVRHDLGTGLPTLEFEMHDDWNDRVGTQRAALPLATLARTQGLGAGRIRNGSDPIEIRVRSPLGEDTSPEELVTAAVSTASGPVPLLQLADIQPQWRPAALRHRNGVREVQVSAELAPGSTFASVLKDFERQAVELPAGVELAYGGEAEGSEEANAALLRTVPVGLGLLVFFLLLEFDSFRRLGIILSTVPLAAMGVIPGLAVTGQPFGFMSMLGVFALVGIVVNNAIVLLGVIEHRRDEGDSVQDAVQEAVRVRLRPILLTSLTTVAGMIPLALSPSALWPPLASAMISGLVASTVLTLVVVPALYMLLFGEGPKPARRWLTLGLLAPTLASASPLTLEQVMEQAATAPQVQIAHAEADSAHRDANAAWLDRATPMLVAGGDGRRLGSDVAIDTPFGPIVQQPQDLVTYGLRAQQPLLDPAGWTAAAAGSQGASAARWGVERTREVVAARAADLFLDLVVTDARIAALEQQEAAIEATVTQALQLAEAGLAIEVDALRAQLALANVRQANRGLAVARATQHDQLRLLLGRDQPIEPVFSPTAQVNPSARPDRRAAELAERAARTERLAYAASVLPTLNARIGVEGSDNENLVKSNWTVAGVEAQWSFGLGRIARMDGASARIQARQTQREQLDRSIVAEMQAAERRVELQRANLAVREISADLATRAVQVLEDRYQQQLVPVTEVLEAQAERAAQTQALREAQVELVRAQIAVALAGS